MPIGTAAVATAVKPLESELRSITEEEPPSISFSRSFFLFPTTCKAYAVGLPAHALVHNPGDKTPQTRPFKELHGDVRTRPKALPHFRTNLHFFPEFHVISLHAASTFEPCSERARPVISVSGDHCTCRLRAPFEAATLCCFAMCPRCPHENGPDLGQRPEVEFVTHFFAAADFARRTLRSLVPSF